MHRKALIGCIISIGFVIISSKQSFASSLSTLSDTISTSRPSAAAPILQAADQAALDGQVSIYDDNAVFLYNDSATFYADPVGGGETTDNAAMVASMSAAGVPSANHRTVYFQGTIAHKHHIGDAVVVPITALHTISFKPVATIPASGKIIISFPTLASADTNPASPSASSFQFNGLVNTNVKFNNATCTSVIISGTSAGSAPTITCTLTSSVAAGTTVTVLVGCTTAGITCSAANQVPTLINPMRKQPPGANAGQGVATAQADNWKIGVTTQDNNSVTLDQGTAVIGTIESVQVQASIDPTLTFQIIGVADATTVNNAFVAGCPSSGTSTDITNSGIGTSATNVNLGTVGTGITIAAQKIIVSTNGTGGYALTATASGQLTDSTVGHSVTSSTTPAGMTAGTELFGIHPCGSDVTTTTWNLDNSGPYYINNATKGWLAWPTASTSLSLANHSGTANSDTTAIEYAITASPTTPAGLYTAVITYVATPTFN